MSGKIKEYVNKKILLYSLKSGQHRTMLLESEKKESHASDYLKTRHPLESNRRLPNQSRESPTKRTMKHYYSATPFGRLDWSR
jgi:hypothetical protein